MSDHTAPNMATAFGDIGYLDRGSGPPVLVIHGSPGDAAQGSQLGDFLVRAGFRVVSPSRPGYPGTALTDKNASIDAQADAHAALMDGLGIDRFSLMCWSGGGPSTYRLAVRHPDRVQALVTLAAVSQEDHWHDSFVERFAFETRFGNWLLRQYAHIAPKSFVSATLAAEGKLSRPQLKELTTSVMADPDKRALILSMADGASRLPPHRDGIKNDMSNFAAITDLELRKITCPTLLIHGRNDRDVLPEYSEFAASQIANATLEWMTPGTHVCVYTEPGSQAAQSRIAEFFRTND